MEQIRLFNDDCLTAMKQLEDNSIDSIVTDPPYGLSFMNKHWDYDVPSVEIWKECLRVLKPGGHLLSFAGSRTYHRMAVRIEDAGFEIRDQIMWVFGSGFPKSLNIAKTMDKFIKTGNASWNGTGDSSNGALGFTKLQHKQGYRPDDYSNRHTNKEDITEELAQEWEGWGTALKPAHEPIVMARKPFKGSVVENVLKYGTGGININESRIGTDKIVAHHSPKGTFAGGEPDRGSSKDYYTTEGRFPANIIFDEEAGKILDEQSSEASRFFYCPKANKKDRDEGINNLYLIENNLICEIETLNQQLKDISEDMIKIMENQEWNTILFGSNITDQYQQDFKFITSIILKMIIGLKTLNYYPHLNTKDYIVDVIKMIKGNGLSLVDYVEQINLLKQNITNEKMEYHLGVVSAVLPTLLEINKKGKTGNFHATVKPTKLMEYLIKLVTPKNGIVLDPFLGSGSTGKAAIKNNFGFIGIEREKEYFEIAKARIEYENTLNYPIEINQDKL